MVYFRKSSKILKEFVKLIRRGFLIYIWYFDTKGLSVVGFVGVMGLFRAELKVIVDECVCRVVVWKKRPHIFPI